MTEGLRDEKKLKTCFTATTIHLIRFLCLPVCLIILLSSLIVCLIFGLSLCITIYELAGVAWSVSMVRTELISDTKESGAIFLSGAAIAWISLQLFNSMLRVTRKFRARGLGWGHTTCKLKPQMISGPK